MNCIKVQEAIWCGELDPDMLHHIASCPECKSEQRKVQELSFALENVDIPMQSRSLLPSRQEIEQSLRARQRARLTKWGIGWVAAAACVALAVVAVPSLFQNSGKQQLASSTTASNSGDTSQTKSTDATGVPSDTSQLGQQDKSNQQPPLDQSLVTMKAGAYAQQFPQEITSVQAYLTKVSDPNIFKHITIKNFVQDPANSDNDNISGTITLTIQHQAGQVSAYGTGDGPFDVTRFAHFTKQQGLWTLTDPFLSTTPFDLHSTAGFHAVDTAHYTLQLPDFLQGAVAEDGTLLITNQGKQMGSLHIEAQKPHNPGDYYSAVDLPSQAEVVSKTTINTDKPNLHIVQFQLKLTNPDGNQNVSVSFSTRTYFMNDDKVVFDLIFPQEMPDAVTLGKIISSFQVK